MTTQELIAMVQDFTSYDLDMYQGESPTDDQVVSALNWAQRIISRKVNLYDPKVELTLTADVDTYDLRDLDVVSKRVLKPLKVFINKDPLYTADGRAHGLWAMDELEALVPRWRTDIAGQPVRAVHLGTKLFLNPMPTQTVVDAGDCYISGLVFATDLSSGTPSVSPDLPEEVHECLAYFAAVRSAMPNVTEQEGWARLKAYQESWQGLVEEIGRENRSQIMSWGTTSGMALGPDVLELY